MTRAPLELTGLFLARTGRSAVLRCARWVMEGQGRQKQVSSPLEKGSSEIDSTGAIEAELTEDKGKVRRRNKKRFCDFSSAKGESKKFNNEN